MNMYISVEDRIRERIMQMKRGEVFFPENFFDLGSETACRKALERMSGKGEIMFVARGIYAFPEKSELFGDVPPKALYASIVAHRELFSKIGGVDYKLHFPPHLNPLPPEALMAKWKSDYENVRASMILEPDSDIRFETVLNKVRELTQRFNEG